MAIAYIALGSNMGYAGRTPAETMCAAISALSETGAILAQSSVYRTEPVGVAAQPSFLNAVVAVETVLEAAGLLERLLEIEKSFGRDRSSATLNGPRTLDLDLLLLDQTILHTETLVLPHPRMAERRFVLQPLAEIAPDLRHPILGSTIRQLLEELPDKGVHRPDAVQRVAP